MRNTRVRDVMSSPAIVISSEALLEEADELMERHCIRRLPVVDGTSGRLVGILSQGDLREASMAADTAGQYAPEEELETWLTVAEAMTPTVITVKPDATIAEVARLMLSHKIGGLPVVNEAGEVIGMITESDIFKLVVQAWGGEET